MSPRGEPACQSYSANNHIIPTEQRICQAPSEVFCCCFLGDEQLTEQWVNMQRRRNWKVLNGTFITHSLHQGPEIFMEMRPERL